MIEVVLGSRQNEGVLNGCLFERTRGIHMDLSNLSQETQTYMTQMMERRSRSGILDLEVCQEILEHGRNTQSDAVYGIGCYFMAEYYWRDRQEDKTMRYLTESTKCFLTEGLYELLSRSYNMMGHVSANRDNRVAALNYFYMALQYAEKCGLIYERGMVNYNIGFMLMSMKRFKQAMEHCERAIDLYARSGDSFYRSYNIVLGMQLCGSCYLKLGRVEKALALLEQIEKMQNSQPDRSFPEINIISFHAECAAAKGDKAVFLEGVRDVIEIVRQQQGIEDAADNLESLMELLFQFEEYELLDELFRIMEEKGLEDSPLLFMSLYPYRSESLLKQQRTEEYLDCTRRYFEAYEKERRGYKLGTARVMELQDELREVEQAQARISADNRRLASIALYDSMTKLANRNRINEYLSERFEEAQKNNGLLGVEIMDIDYFKDFNDTYGHLAGDECLQAVAGILQKAQKKGKVFCGRYGGDEFVVIYSGMSVGDIENVAQKIQDQVRGLAIPHEKSECSDIVTISQGIFVNVPDKERHEWDFNSMADITLYQAKRDGRNRYRIQAEFK